MDGPSICVTFYTSGYDFWLLGIPATTVGVIRFPPDEFAGALCEQGGGTDACGSFGGGVSSGGVALRRCGCGASDAGAGDGASRADAARLCGMDRQTLRDWVLRYNAHGLAGLFDSKQIRRGPKPKLSAVQQQELAEIVRQGPDMAEDGVVRWRRTDLAGVIAARFGVTLAERTVLRNLGFRRLSARPQHPKQGPDAMEAYKN